MAIYVKIRKYATDGSRHVYEFSDDYFAEDFYVMVDANSKELKFYKDAACKHLLRTLDLSRDDTPVGSLQGVGDSTFFIILRRMIKALRKNEFPDILDYCA